MLNALRPLLLLAAFAAVLPTAAQDEPTPPPTEIRSQREDAGARVRQVERSGGRVLQAEPMQRGGQEVYRFKVLTPEGRVRVEQGEPGSSRGGRDNPRAAANDRNPELTAQRRPVREDGGSGVAREREQRSPTRREPPPSRAAGDSAGD